MENNNQIAGQTMIEYILLVTAVVVVLLVFLGPTGRFRSEVERHIVNGAVTMLEKMAAKTSFVTPPPVTPIP